MFGRVVAWSLWYFHNQFLWHADTSTVASAFASSLGQDWPVARSTYQQVRPATAQAVAAPVVSWSRPQVGCIKCNIDTAFSENMQQASYGLVVRDQGGAFICEVTNPSVKHLTKLNENKLKKQMDNYVTCSVIYPL